MVLQELNNNEQVQEIVLPGKLGYGIKYLLIK
jgi:hypothetical protein